MHTATLLVLLVVLVTGQDIDDPGADYQEAGFEIPDAIVEVFKPRGLRVSIPRKYYPKQDFILFTTCLLSFVKKPFKI